MAATGSKAGPLHHAFIRALILGTSVEGYISLCGVIADAKPPDYASVNVPLLKMLVQKIRQLLFLDVRKFYKHTGHLRRIKACKSWIMVTGIVWKILK